jgi:hypothetical protein
MRRKNRMKITNEQINKIFPDKKDYICEICGHPIQRKVTLQILEIWNTGKQEWENIWENDHILETGYFCTNPYPKKDCSPVKIKIEEIS